MKHYKLPFDICLKRKYNDINIENYLSERNDLKEKRKDKVISIDNDLHIEIGKFQTYDIDLSEIIDLGMRFALGKQEFRKLVAMIIENKNKNNNND